MWPQAIAGRRSYGRERKKLGFIRRHVVTVVEFVRLVSAIVAERARSNDGGVLFVLVSLPSPATWPNRSMISLPAIVAF